jgi:hypothetical protein
MSGATASQADGDANTDRPHDDELGPLQLPLMQDEFGRFLSPSKEWSLAPDDPDLAMFE